MPPKTPRKKPRNKQGRPLGSQEIAGRPPEDDNVGDLPGSTYGAGLNSAEKMFPGNQGTVSNLRNFAAIDTINSVNNVNQNGIGAVKNFNTGSGADFKAPTTGDMVEDLLRRAQNAVGQGLLDKREVMNLFKKDFGALSPADLADAHGGNINALKQRLNAAEANPAIAAQQVQNRASREAAAQQHFNTVVQPFLNQHQGQGFFAVSPQDNQNYTESFTSFGMKNHKGEVMWQTSLNVIPSNKDGDDELGALFVNQQHVKPAFPSTGGASSSPTSLNIQQRLFETMFGSGQDPRTALRNAAAGQGDDDDANLTWHSLIQQGAGGPGAGGKMLRDWGMPKNLVLSPNEKLRGNPTVITGGVDYGSDAYSANIAATLKPGETHTIMNREEFYEQNQVTSRKGQVRTITGMSSFGSGPGKAVVGQGADMRVIGVGESDASKVLKRQRLEGQYEQRLGTQTDGGFIPDSRETTSAFVTNNGDVINSVALRQFRTIGSAGGVFGEGQAFWNTNQNAGKGVFQERSWTMDLPEGGMSDETKQELDSRRGKRLENNTLNINGRDHDLGNNWESSWITDYEVVGNKLRITGGQGNANTAMSMKYGQKELLQPGNLSELGLDEYDIVGPMSGDMLSMASSTVDVMNQSELTDFFSAHEQTMRARDDSEQDINDFHQTFFDQDNNLRQDLRYTEQTIPKVLSAFIDTHVPNNYVTKPITTVMHKDMIENYLTEQGQNVNQFVDSFFDGNRDKQSELMRNLMPNAPEPTDDPDMFKVTVNAVGLDLKMGTNFRTELSSGDAAFNDTVRRARYANASPAEKAALDAIGSQKAVSAGNVIKASMMNSGEIEEQDAVDMQQLSPAVARKYQKLRDAKLEEAGDSASQAQIIDAHMQALQEVTGKGKKPLFGEGSVVKIGNNYLANPASVDRNRTLDDLGEQVGAVRDYSTVMDDAMNQIAGTKAGERNFGSEVLSRVVDKQADLAEGGTTRKTALGGGRNSAVSYLYNTNSKTLAANEVVVDKRKAVRGMAEGMIAQGVDRKEAYAEANRTISEREANNQPVMVSGATRSPSLDEEQSTVNVNVLTPKQFKKKGGFGDVFHNMAITSPIFSAVMRGDVDADALSKFWAGKVKKDSKGNVLKNSEGRIQFEEAAATSNADMIEMGRNAPGGEFQNQRDSIFAPKQSPDLSLSGLMSTLRKKMDVAMKGVGPKELAEGAGKTARAAGNMGEFYNWGRMFEVMADKQGRSKKDAREMSSTMSRVASSVYQGALDIKDASPGVQRLQELTHGSFVTGRNERNENLWAGATSGGSNNLEMFAKGLFGGVLNSSDEEMNPDEAAFVLSPSSMTKKQKAALSTQIASARAELGDEDLTDKEREVLSTKHTNALYDKVMGYQKPGEDDATTPYLDTNAPITLLAAKGALKSMSKDKPQGFNIAPGIPDEPRQNILKKLAGFGAMIESSIKLIGKNNMSPEEIALHAQAAGPELVAGMGNTQWGRFIEAAGLRKKVSQPIDVEDYIKRRKNLGKQNAADRQQVAPPPAPITPEVEAPEARSIPDAPDVSERSDAPDVSERSDSSQEPDFSQIPRNDIPPDEDTGYDPDGYAMPGTPGGIGYTPPPPPPSSPTPPSGTGGGDGPRRMGSSNIQDVRIIGSPTSLDEKDVQKANTMLGGFKANNPHNELKELAKLPSLTPEQGKRVLELRQQITDTSNLITQAQSAGNGPSNVKSNVYSEQISALAGPGFAKGPIVKAFQDITKGEGSQFELLKRAGEAVAAGQAEKRDQQTDKANSGRLERSGVAAARELFAGRDAEGIGSIIQSLDNGTDMNFVNERDATNFGHIQSAARSVADRASFSQVIKGAAKAAKIEIDLANPKTSPADRRRLETEQRAEQQAAGRSFYEGMSTDERRDYRNEVLTMDKKGAAFAVQAELNPALNDPAYMKYLKGQQDKELGNAQRAGFGGPADDASIGHAKALGEMFKDLSSAMEKTTTVGRSLTKQQVEQVESHIASIEKLTERVGKAQAILNPNSGASPEAKEAAQDYISRMNKITVKDKDGNDVPGLTVLAAANAKIRGSGGLAEIAAEQKRAGQYEADDRDSGVYARAFNAFTKPGEFKERWSSLREDMASGVANGDALDIANAGGRALTKIGLNSFFAFKHIGQALIAPIEKDVAAYGSMMDANAQSVGALGFGAGAVTGSESFQQGVGYRSSQQITAENNGRAAYQTWSPLMKATSGTFASGIRAIAEPALGAFMATNFLASSGALAGLGEAGVAAAGPIAGAAVVGLGVASNMFDYNGDESRKTNLFARSKMFGNGNAAWNDPLGASAEGFNMLGAFVDNTFLNGAMGWGKGQAAAEQSRGQVANTVMDLNAGRSGYVNAQNATSTVGALWETNFKDKFSAMGVTQQDFTASAMTTIAMSGKRFSQDGVKNDANQILIDAGVMKAIGNTATLKSIGVGVDQQIQSAQSLAFARTGLATYGEGDTDLGQAFVDYGELGGKDQRSNNVRDVVANQMAKSVALTTANRHNAIRGVDAVSEYMSTHGSVADKLKLQEQIGFTESREGAATSGELLATTSEGQLEYDRRASRLEGVDLQIYSRRGASVYSPISNMYRALGYGLGATDNLGANAASRSMYAPDAVVASNEKLANYLGITDQGQKAAMDTASVAGLDLSQRFAIAQSKSESVVGSDAWKKANQGVVGSFQSLIGSIIDPAGFKRDTDIKANVEQARVSGTQYGVDAKYLPGEANFTGLSERQQGMAQSMFQQLAPVAGIYGASAGIFGSAAYSRAQDLNSQGNFGGAQQLSTNFGALIGQAAGRAKYGGFTSDDQAIASQMALHFQGNQAGFDQYQAMTQNDPIALSQFVDRNQTAANQRYYTMQTGARGGTAGLGAYTDEKLSGLQQDYITGVDTQHRAGITGRMAKFAGLSGVSSMNIEQTENALQELSFDDMKYQQGMQIKQETRTRAFATGKGLAGQAGDMRAAGLSEGMVQLAIGSGGQYAMEDRGVAMSRKYQDIGLSYSGQDLAISQSRFDLGGRQADSSYHLSQQRQNSDFAYQEASMTINRQHAVVQEGWQMQDIQFSRNKSEVNFGWQMEDSDRNLKYARGRDRQDILRQQERAVITHSMDMGQSDKEESRAKQSNKWAEEGYNRERQHFQESKQFQIQSMELDRQHYLENRQLEAQSMELQRQRFTTERQQITETRKLEDQQRALKRAGDMQGMRDAEQMSAHQRTLSASSAALQSRLTELHKALELSSARNQWDSIVNGMNAIAKSILNLNSAVQHSGGIGSGVGGSHSGGSSGSHSYEPAASVSSSQASASVSGAVATKLAETNAILQKIYEDNGKTGDMNVTIHTNDTKSALKSVNDYNDSYRRRRKRA